MSNSKGSHVNPTKRGRVIRKVTGDSGYGKHTGSRKVSRVKIEALKKDRPGILEGMLGKLFGR